mmetsp:Transcript_22564/g.57094  ORF Transcript_22564/g.57094 Transcript_22564/m.57094 type:complete len:257 (+) Transcript_22564:619-1389(+)
MRGNRAVICSLSARSWRVGNRCRTSVCATNSAKSASETNLRPGTTTPTAFLSMSPSVVAWSRLPVSSSLLRCWSCDAVSGFPVATPDARPDAASQVCAAKTTLSTTNVGAPEASPSFAPWLFFFVRTKFTTPSWCGPTLRSSTEQNCEPATPSASRSTACFLTHPTSTSSRTAWSSPFCTRPPAPPAPTKPGCFTSMRKTRDSSNWGEYRKFRFEKSESPMDRSDPSLGSWSPPASLWPTGSSTHPDEYSTGYSFA